MLSNETVMTPLAFDQCPLLPVTAQGSGQRWKVVPTLFSLDEGGGRSRALPSRRPLISRPSSYCGWSQLVFSVMTNGEFAQFFQRNRGCRGGHDTAVGRGADGCGASP